MNNIVILPFDQTRELLQSADAVCSAATVNAAVARVATQIIGALGDRNLLVLCVVLPNRYVFGFGMDVYGWWRNLPAVYALRE